MRKLYALAAIGGACILGAVLAGCVLFPRQTPTVTPDMPHPKSETRSHDWIQTTVAEFETGTRQGLTITSVEDGELELAVGVQRGVYTSPVVAADFDFTGIVPHWRADVSDDQTVLIEVRTLSSGEDWSAWQSLADIALFVQDGRTYPETPFTLSGGEQFQYRATLLAAPGQVSPVLHEVTITYMNTEVGPTTDQAQSFIVLEQSSRGVPAPPVISREGWGADESYLDWDPEYVPSRKIVIHHTVTQNDYAEPEAAQWVRAIYYYHAVTLGWGDVGYNYLVDQYGNIYEGRNGGDDVVAGHVYGYNYGTTGVAALGTHGNMGGSVPATEAALEALTSLSAWEAARRHIHPLGESFIRDTVTANLGGHRDYPPHGTSCPGDLLYAQLPALRESVWTRMQAYLFRYSVEWVSPTLPVSVTLQTSTTYEMSVGARNSGWFTWPQGSAQHPVRLGYHWIDEHGERVVQPPQYDHRTPLDRDVPFGDLYEFDGALFTTPTEPGTYTLAWDMVHELVVWFHDAVPESPLLTVQFEVVDQPGVTPTPTAEPAAIENGGFEEDRAWTIFETSYPARYVTEPRRSGQRAMQTGIADPAGNVYSFSSVEQTFTVPTGDGATLRYWYQAQVVPGDYTYVYLYADGTGWQPLLINKDNAPDWTEGVHDLSPYVGREVTLRFGTYNDGREGVSAMFVDDVSVRPGAGPPPTVTPTTARPPTTAPTATRPPTATPTPTVTPTPTPVACVELAVNSGFETDEGWSIPFTPYPARYTTAMAFRGQRSLQVGIPDPVEDRFSYSSAEQRITVPAGRTVNLSLWFFMPSSGGAGDYGYVLIRPDGGAWQAVGWVNSVTGDWTSMEADLSAYAGQTVTLRIGVRNDGLNDGATAAMYVDELSVEACAP